MSFEKFKTKELTKPRDKAWENFAKFEKEGDKKVGIVRDVFYRPADETFKEQRCFTLEEEDGTLCNVCLKREPYFAIRPTNDVRLGDLLTVELSELRAAKTKGYNATKIYSFVAGEDPEGGDDRPTVKELEEQDMRDQNAVVEDEDTDSEEEKEDVPFE